MLILGRRVDQSIILETGKERIVIMVTKIEHGTASIGIDAPPSVTIKRDKFDDGRKWERKVEQL